MMNISNCCTFQASLLYTIVLPVLIMEFVFGIASNGFGLWMFSFHMKTWKPNSSYLLNLVGFLTLVAMDRYLIFHPFWKVNRVSGRDAIIISCLLWIVSFSMSHLLVEPHAFQFHNSTQCESFNICPASFSLALWHDAYINGKIQKAVRFVVTVAIVFTICYFPSNMVRISLWIMKLQYKEGCNQFKYASTAFYSTVCFTYFYSMLNPIIY
ncbi:LOW QUALITY PROTEIN: hydroxycarboxylic acid receptor 2-like [Microcaecilia unicolor]|uniref:LOW QUALITY PROTEIN: hydroxycarboxylic acid receptor 2-like n=1 Tax=Microcaecilia unicolor TaxID=1415580 RepID=A0A6P7Z4E9_9AMPH|nr:LOW QUALITY PROTEIN: hydroxycarboxylic acid receptor 2-like [Microcaecilia unicolor]